MKVLTRPWFLILVFVVVFVLWPAGCATSSTDRGPAGGRPVLTVSYLRHFEMRDPRLPEQLVTVATANISNPSTRPIRVRLDCTRSLTTLTVAPRTTEHVLLDPKDRTCRLTEVSP